MTMVDVESSAQIGKKDATNVTSLVGNAREVNVVIKDAPVEVSSEGVPDEHLPQRCASEKVISDRDATDEDVSIDDSRNQKPRRRRKRRSRKSTESRSEKKDQLTKESLSSTPIEGQQYSLKKREWLQDEPARQKIKSKSKLAYVRRTIRKQMKLLRRKAIRSIENVRLSLKRTYDKLKRYKKKKSKKYTVSQRHQGKATPRTQRKNQVQSIEESHKEQGGSQDLSECKLSTIELPKKEVNGDESPSLQNTEPVKGNEEGGVSYDESYDKALNPFEE